MKKTIYIILLMLNLIGLTLGAFAQHPEPQRKDTRIIIEVDTSKGSALDQVIKAGTASGFTPALIQPQYNIISWSDSKQVGCTFTLYTTIKGTKLIITGGFVQSLGLYGSAPGVVDYRLSGLDTRRKCWDMMQKVADNIESLQILYDQ